MTEEWRAIPGYTGKYEISSLGRVRSLSRFVTCARYSRKISGRILTPCNNGRGYYYVRLCDGKNQPVVYIHRIVARVFVSNPRKYRQVDHINRDNSDNRAVNIRWCSASENQKNKRICDTHSSKYNGVAKCGGTWRAAIFISGKTKHLGCFKTEIDAARAFNNEVQKRKLNRVLNTI